MCEEYLVQLLSLTKQQTIALKNDDYEDYIEIVQKRQVLIDYIDNERKENQVSEKEFILINEIKQIDDYNRKEYIRQLDETKKQLKKINEANKKNQAYINPYSSIAGGMNFDTK